MKNAIVLAAGQGTRMQSSLPKVMHELLGKPMIELVVDNLQKGGVDKIVAVVNSDSEQIRGQLGDRVDYAVQEQPLGTINAVGKVDQLVDCKGDTLILHGDYGLIQKETIESIFEKHKGYDLTIITAKPKEAGTARRVIRDNQGEIAKIVEYQNLDDSTINENEITVGIYCVNNELLYKYLPELVNGAVTAGANVMGLVEIMKNNGHSIQGIRVQDYRDMQGINDRAQLAQANAWLQEKINNYWLANGVTILDPKSTYIGPDVVFEGDNIVYPNNHLYGNVKIGKNTILYPNNFIINSMIGENTTIDNARITDSSVGDNTTVGPYAHLRMHTEVGSDSRVGNFVEFKNVIFQDGAKSAHLTYLGDASIGKNVNIGCGVVTANFDGHKKHRTVVGDGTFVGSHTTIVAPVKIGENALTAAGSVITSDVEDEAMGIARSRQTNKEGLGKKFKNKG